MYQILLSFVLLFLISVSASGQGFLKKYPKLTRRNIEAFMLDWKQFSDNLAQNLVITDTVLYNISKDEYSLTDFYNFKNLKGSKLFENSRENPQPKSEPKYRVVPQYITVENFKNEVDTVNPRIASPIFLTMPPESDSSFLKTDSIIPPLPEKGLYLTKEVDRVLSTFLGGLKKGEDSYTKINKKNLKKLKDYIPVNPGHWGGYWWFETLPMTEYFIVTPNLIVQCRRTTWCNGDQIWYVKDDDTWIRRGPKGGWIE